MTATSMTALDLLDALVRMGSAPTQHAIGN
jgi:hypothetical protein